MSQFTIAGKRLAAWWRQQPDLFHWKVIAIVEGLIIAAIVLL